MFPAFPQKACLTSIKVINIRSNLCNNFVSFTELQDTFYVFDQNGDGMITTDELATVLFKLGQRPTLREVQAMIKSVDADSK